jgi:hypothetical protein
VRYYLTTTPLLAGLLPLSATNATIMPITTSFLTLDFQKELSLKRAARSDIWTKIGDGKAKPKPLRFDVTITASTEQDALTQAESLITLAESVTSILRWDPATTAVNANIRRRDVQGCSGALGTPQKSGLYVLPISLEFLPFGAFWTLQDGTGSFKF